MLTGSQVFLLLEKSSQSLAGRVAVLELWPLALAEALFRGGHPRIVADGLDPVAWLGS